jgi:hypothetical protein
MVPAVQALRGFEAIPGIIPRGGGRNGKAPPNHLTTHGTVLPVSENKTMRGLQRGFSDRKWRLRAKKRVIRERLFVKFLSVRKAEYCDVDNGSTKGHER